MSTRLSPSHCCRALAPLLVLSLAGCDRIPGLQPRAGASLSPSTAAAGPSPAPCPQPTPRDQDLDIFSDDGPYIGFASDGSYTITAFELGLDRWENGRASDAKTQWGLTCTAKLAGARPVSQHCELDEIDIQPWGLGPVIFKRSYSTSEGSLRLVRGDWQGGALDLRLHRDEITTEIELRFDHRNSGLRLVSLRAVEVFRSALGGELTTREYRLPTYSTVMMVPVQMKGRFSAARQRWDSLIASLSPADQAAWKAAVADPKNRPSMDNKAMVEIMTRRPEPSIPDWKAINEGKREPTKEEEARMQAVMGEELLRRQTEWIAVSGLSEAGQRSILEFTREQIRTASP